MFQHFPLEIRQEKPLLRIGSVRKEEKEKSVAGFGNVLEFNPTESPHLSFNQPFRQEIREENSRGDGILFLCWAGGQGYLRAKSVHVPWGESKV